ncbi:MULTISPECIES: hypothetical protein [Cellulomonas]|uniref:Uncharacterized protein n=1 Tax=Cellulomonas uda TaxID=1714 RepID=A0A4Y3KEH2_CELUD|nr:MULTISPECIES: hypothetical protein [Cellulomonas]ASR55650.1 hypothetical protein CBP52_11730 [Cellulomonas sp. PSBB021]NII66705.1 hypothetical protein [Cellulomonas uda]GEA81774.1 hypothetical protein CUD01_22180 [Cellulomonas uda]
MEEKSSRRTGDWNSPAFWVSVISLALSTYLALAAGRQWFPFPQPDHAQENAARVTWAYERLGSDDPDGQTKSFAVTVTNNSTSPVYNVRLRLGLWDDRYPTGSDDNAPDLPTMDVPLELRDVPACSVSTATVPVSTWRDTSEDTHIRGYAIGIAFALDGQQWWSDQPYQTPWRDDTIFEAYMTHKTITYDVQPTHGPGCG